MLVFRLSSKGLLEASGFDFGSILGCLEMGLGRILQVFACYCWLVARFRLLLLLFVCFGFLLLSLSLSSKSVSALACFCLLGHVSARRSVEPILKLHSSWLHCSFLPSSACFGLLWLLSLSVPLLFRFWSSLKFERTNEWANKQKWVLPFVH